MPVNPITPIPSVTEAGIPTDLVRRIDNVEIEAGLCLDHSSFVVFSINLIASLVNITLALPAAFLPIGTWSSSDCHFLPTDRTIKSGRKVGKVLWRNLAHSTNDNVRRPGWWR
jgi:hypothetical protein